MSTLAVPDEFDMKCFFCGYYLSVGPVKSSSDGTKFQCGRCDFEDRNINIRNYSYENLAKYLAFPCSHKNCNEKIPWSQVQKHELSCSFRRIMCPIHSCAEMVLPIKICDHFKDAHDTNISPFTICLDPYQYEYITIINHENEVFICFILQDTNLLMCGVYSVSNNIHKTFQVNLYSELSQQVVLKEIEIIPYDSRKHCTYWYLREHCNLKLHKNASKESNVMPLINTYLSYLQVFLSSEKLYCKISINPVNIKITKSIDIIRKIVECPVCYGYMFDHIYSCPTGHSICQKCKSQLTNCPSCRAAFNETRNFSLEELAKGASIQCRSINCNFIGTVKELSLHEINCNNEV